MSDDLRMWLCPNCCNIVQGREYCEKCGTYKNICPNCKTVLSEDEEFCPKCGYKKNEVISTDNIENY